MSSLIRQVLPSRNRRCDPRPIHVRFVFGKVSVDQVYVPFPMSVSSHQCSIHLPVPLSVSVYIYIYIYIVQRLKVYKLILRIQISLQCATQTTSLCSARSSRASHVLIYGSVTTYCQHRTRPAPSARLPWCDVEHEPPL